MADSASHRHDLARTDGWYGVAVPAVKVALEASKGQVSAESLRALQTVIKVAIRENQPDWSPESETDLTGLVSAEHAGTRLTRREVQVLKGCAAGMSNLRIGHALSVSEDTVKTHLRQVFTKMGATCRAHAVAKAFRAGLLP